jgi:L-rhamnose mutarotase
MWSIKSLFSSPRPKGAKLTVAESPEAVERPFHVVSHHGSLIRLRPDFEERYIILHKHTFPEVLQRIAKSNVRDYSIFLAEGMLFSHFDYVGKSFASDMAAMGDEVTKEWWKLTAPMQVPLKSRKKGEWWASMELVSQFGGEISSFGRILRGAARRHVGRVAIQSLKSFFLQRKQALSELLRKHSLQSTTLYFKDGWLYLYCEYSGQDRERDVQLLLENIEFRRAQKEFAAFLKTPTRQSEAKFWEPMRLVFYTA